MELRDYLRVLQSRRWLILISIIITVLLALAFSLLQKPAYQGVAEVVVSQQNTGLAVLGTALPDSSYQPGRDDVQTQVEVIHSPRIADRVIETLGLKSTVNSLLGQVTASADTGTNVISIQAIGPSAALARAIANTFAEQYIAWSRESQRASIRAAAEDIELRLAEVQNQIVAAQTTASRPNATASEQATLDAATALYGRLAESMVQLRIAEQLATGNGSLLSSAALDPVPVSPNPARNAALAASIGLFIGLGVAFAAEHLDTRIKSVREVADLCGAPVLANIPTVQVRKTQTHKLALVHRPGSSEAEAYRMLRTSLDATQDQRATKTLLVTSGAPNEGKSTVAANLAAVLSQAGKRVVLVVCDFHRPAAESLFELERGVGLSEVLTGASDFRAAARQPDHFDNLWVLSAGAMPPNPSELLGSEAMGRLVAELSEQLDWLILDSAPVLATADAAVVARWVDGVLLTARVGVSKREALQACCDHLATAGADIIGLAVLGPVESNVAKGYDGYGTAGGDVS